MSAPGGVPSRGCEPSTGCTWHTPPPPGRDLVSWPCLYGHEKGTHLQPEGTCDQAYTPPPHSTERDLGWGIHTLLLWTHTHTNENITFSQLRLLAVKMISYKIIKYYLLSSQKWVLFLQVRRTKQVFACLTCNLSALNSFVNCDTFYRLKVTCDSKPKVTVVVRLFKHLQLDLV